MCVYLNFTLENLPGEVWLPIFGWEGSYEISNKGRVKSLPKKYPIPNNGGIRISTVKIHKLDIGKKKGKEYARAKLNLNNCSKKYSVHRLVATHFIPNVENKPQVNHKDGNKLNNDVNNLEWATSSENQIHAIQTGLIKEPAKRLGIRQGITHGRTILSEKNVYSIRKKYDEGEKISKIAKEYPNLDSSTIRSVCIRKNWKHLPEL